MENIENIPIKAVPNSDSIPNILILVVIEAIIFFNTSILDIIILINKIENHSGLYKLPNALPTTNNKIPLNSVS
jgi:hypothetical protein